MVFSTGDPNAASIFASLNENGTENLQLALGQHDNPYVYEVFFLNIFMIASVKMIHL
jgi:hypothetical protein